MDGNNFIELVDFMLLFKHLEPNKYSCFTAKSMFEKSSEQFKNSEGVKVMGLSFGQFAVVCTEYDIFKWEKQFSFLGTDDPKEIINSAQLLYTNIELRTKYVMNLLRPVNMWITYFSRILNNIKLFASKKQPRLSKSICIYIYIYNY